MQAYNFYNFFTIYNVLPVDFQGWNRKMQHFFSLISKVSNFYSTLTAKIDKTSWACSRSIYQNAQIGDYKKGQTFKQELQPKKNTPFGVQKRSSGFFGIKFFLQNVHLSFFQKPHVIKLSCCIVQVKQKVFMLAIVATTWANYSLICS